MDALSGRAARSARAMRAAPRARPGTSNRRTRAKR